MLRDNRQGPVNIGPPPEHHFLFSVSATGFLGVCLCQSVQKVPFFCTEKNVDETKKGGSPSILFDGCTRSPFIFHAFFFSSFFFPEKRETNFSSYVPFFHFFYLIILCLNHPLTLKSRSHQKDANFDREERPSLLPSFSLSLSFLYSGSYVAFREAIVVLIQKVSVKAVLTDIASSFYFSLKLQSD